MASEPRQPTRPSFSRQPTRSSFSGQPTTRSSFSRSLSGMLVKSVSGALAPTKWLAKPFEATEEFSGDETIQALKECLQCPILCFCLLKHVLSTIFFCVMSISLLTLTPNEAATLQIYSPSATTVYDLVSAVGHGYAIVELIYQYLWRLEPKTQARPRSGLWRQCLNRIQQSRTATCWCQLLEISAQSYQAWSLSYMVSSMPVVALYTACIALNAILSPWLLCSRIAYVHRTLRLFINGVFGFTLNTGFPLIELVPRLLKRRLTPRAHISQLRNDPLWITTIVLYTRGFNATTGVGLIVKIVSTLLNFWTLRLLVSSIWGNPKRKPVSFKLGPRLSQVIPSPGIGPPEQEVSLRRNSRIVSLAQLPQARYWNFRISGTSKVLCTIMGAWGALLFAATGLLIAQPPSALCPSDCLLHVTPLFHLSCDCVYYRHVCEKNASSNLTALMSPSRLGDDLFFLEIVHCALPNGLPPALLLPFESLLAVRILHSNMTAYDVSARFLPTSLVYLEIRYSQLTQVPAIVATALPPNLMYLALDGNAIKHVPRETLAAWRPLTSLHMSETNIADEVFSGVVEVLPQLTELSLHHTAVTTIPMRLFDLPLLTHVFLSSTAISALRIPSNASSPLLLLDVSCTAVVPHGLWPAYVVQGRNATYCTSPMRAKECSPALLNNYLCDVPCATIELKGDDGACAPYFEVA
ncbi:hypothetical protein SPRG_11187 [Saprolegnia parasitica CBS 223.65]|uniref:Uncharacterized protein n=1 Tax=Saprolegnia parasitica (strain CBS 223.65) TaxID=695850 RepID=A0A067C8Y6_SAPPC|nr:hypothetical protein SPRG_11187 [Saprolegnia parasitica CBS 223.65]KDO23257.1 hypothetical protein SPRG_11187 [Saprolegnia parasitica CBS 223.65]|eukprot:XP_012206045.1 hypothetical protein SPRG_11187 [Saprolegnia parasitica CBS 223.65]